MDLDLDIFYFGSKNWHKFLLNKKMEWPICNLEQFFRLRNLRAIFCFFNFSKFLMIKRMLFFYIFLSN